MPCGMLRSAASPGSVGFGRPVSGASGLLMPRFRPATGFTDYAPSGPDDGPALFAEFDQRDHARLDPLGVVDQWRLLAFAARHRLEGVFAGYERHVRHALFERLQSRFHRRSIVAQHMQAGIESDDLNVDFLAFVR